MHGDSNNSEAGDGTAGTGGVGGRSSSSISNSLSGDDGSSTHYPPLFPSFSTKALVELVNGLYAAVKDHSHQLGLIAPVTAIESTNATTIAVSDTAGTYSGFEDNATTTTTTLKSW